MAHSYLLPVGPIMPLRDNPSAKAALWMMGAMLSFTLMAIAGRVLFVHYDTFEIMLYRSLFGICVVLIVGALAGTLKEINRRHLKLHFLRNIFHFAGQNLWFYALVFIPLSQMFAFEFSTPLWVALLAPFILGESWTRTRLLAALLGFIGILLVARPDISSVSPAIFAAITCAWGFAGAILCTKILSRYESVTAILFWLVVMQSAFGLITAGWDGDIAPLRRDMLGWLALVGLCGLFAHFCITTALSLAPASVVAPLEFVRLPFVSVIAFFLYNEPLMPIIFLGAAIIFTANWLNIRAEMKNH